MAEDKRLKISMNQLGEGGVPGIVLRFTDEGAELSCAGFDTLEELHGTLVDLANSVAKGVAQERLKSSLPQSLQRQDERVAAVQAPPTRRPFNPRPMGGKQA